MLVYDKNELKSQLSTEQIFSLLEEFGGEPNYENDYIISKTICHNESGEGSRKLYYYFNSQLFQCYSNCNSFDVFELVIKVMRIQAKKEFDLNDAVRWIAYHFGLSGRIEENETSVLEDWKCLSNYERIQEIDIKTNEISLKEYDNNILKRFNYTVKIMPWLKENIKQDNSDNFYTTLAKQIEYYLSKFEVNAFLSELSTSLYKSKKTKLIVKLV